MELIYKTEKSKVNFKGNVLELLSIKNIKPTGIIIQINGKVITKLNWQSYMIKETDVVVILEIIAGG